MTDPRDNGRPENTLKKEFVEMLTSTQPWKDLWKDWKRSIHWLFGPQDPNTPWWKRRGI